LQRYGDLWVLTGREGKWRERKGSKGGGRERERKGSKGRAEEGKGEVDVASPDL